jgi:hypothetical protein
VGPGTAAGGATGQVLAKASAVDYDTTWVTPSGGGGSGADYDEDRTINSVGLAPAPLWCAGVGQQALSAVANLFVYGCVARKASLAKLWVPTWAPAPVISGGGAKAFLLDTLPPAGGTAAPLHTATTEFDTALTQDIGSQPNLLPGNCAFPVSGLTVGNVYYLCVYFPGSSWGSPLPSMLLWTASNNVSIGFINIGPDTWPAQLRWCRVVVGSDPTLPGQWPNLTQTFNGLNFCIACT